MVYRISHEDPGFGAQKHDGKKLLRQRTIAVLPTLFTLGHLLCGFASIFMASRSPQVKTLPWDWTPLTFAALFIFMGMVMDALDGRIARLTHRTTNLGEQLDSLADMVTFGVAPAFLVVQFVGIGTPFLSNVGDQTPNRLALMIAGIYVACTALRLARFNVEIESSERANHTSFAGLPSPGAAGTIASLLLLHEHFLADHNRHLLDDQSLAEPWFIPLTAFGIVTITLLVAFAMVSRLCYVHVVSRYVHGRVTFGRFAVVVVVIMLLAIDLQASIAVAFVIYALSAPVLGLWRRLRPIPSHAEPALSADIAQSHRDQHQDQQTKTG